MTVTVTIHDVMLGLRPNGEGGKHLRKTLWARFLKICRQVSINGPNVGGMAKFEFKGVINCKWISRKQHLAI